MPYDAKAVGARLKAHREATGLTQAQYAEAVGVARATYSIWEGGQQNISLPGLMLICERFGMSMDFIIYGKK
jgi:transcriptional regulator with XRE-family HTH domain